VWDANTIPQIPLAVGSAPSCRRFSKDTGQRLFLSMHILLHNVKDYCIQGGHFITFTKALAVVKDLSNDIGYKLVASDVS
jgi:hypothetical protein